MNALTTHQKVLLIACVDRATVQLEHARDSFLSFLPEDATVMSETLLDLEQIKRLLKADVTGESEGMVRCLTSGFEHQFFYLGNIYRFQWISTGVRVANDQHRFIEMTYEDFTKNFNRAE